MTMHAHGTFEVKMGPQQPDNDMARAANIGRLSIDKQFTGALAASSKGEMLGVRTATEGSAGYVAMERVEGSLLSRNGTFILQHYGVMQGGTLEQIVTVVPDSGTGELAGLSGKMTIRIEGRQHYYDLEYALP